MAGSYKHIINKEDGSLVSNEEFVNRIDNLGDAYETVEECWHIIQVLSQGDEKKIETAIKVMYKRLNAHWDNE